ncbi:MAG: hypothetical protein Q8L87_03555 [Anaerolineales bacterium]|nr:hypothetical protein [Anaerolineales bacterium]
MRLCVKVWHLCLLHNFRFGIAVLIKERRYLRRSVFIVGRDGRLTYVNYLPILGDEPNYDEVIAAAKKALG